MMRNTAWTPYAALLALALVLRLGVIAATPGYEPRLDSAHYDGLACLLAEGEGYRLRVPRGATADSCGTVPRGENPPTAFRPPGWPAVLAGVYAVTERDRWAAGRVLQALIGTAAVALIGLAGLLLLGPPGLLAATALAAVDTTLLFVGGSLMSEPLFVALTAAAICTAVRERCQARPSYRRLVLAGLLLGAATLVRSNAPVLIPVLALLAAPSWRKALRPLVVIAAATALVVAPWTVRNAVALDAFVPVASYFGTGLAGTFNESARTREDFPGAWVSPRHVPAFRDIHHSDMSELEKQRQLRRRALDHAADHPGYVAEVAVRNTLRILSLYDLDWHRGGAQALALPRWTGIVAVAGFWVLLALVVASVLTGAHRRVPAALWLGPVLLLGSTVIAGGEMRYRAPLIPFLVLIAATLALAGGRFTPPSPGRNRRDPGFPSNTG